MKVSVITINYNNCGGLKKTLDSVIAQNNSEIELIVIDGNSADGSKELLLSYADKLTYWVSEKDQGIYHAQNKGITQAKGEYCLFLNSGDVFADNSVVSKFVPELTETEIVYGDIYTLDANRKLKYLHSPAMIDIHHLMVSTVWHPSAFIKRIVFDKAGLYKESLKITGDYEFFIRAILKHGVTAKHVPLAVCIFDLGGISNSEAKKKQQEEERALSWRLNFSEVMIRAFESWTQLQRSGEYRIYKTIKRILPV